MDKVESKMSIKNKVNPPMEKVSFERGDFAFFEISEGVYCKVRITEVHTEYGRIRYSVIPVEGFGEMKVEKLEKVPTKRQ